MVLYMESIILILNECPPFSAKKRSQFGIGFQKCRKPNFLRYSSAYGENIAQVFEAPFSCPQSNSTRVRNVARQE